MKKSGKAKEFSEKRKEVKQYLKKELEPVGGELIEDDDRRLARIFSSGDDEDG